MRAREIISEIVRTILLMSVAGSVLTLVLFALKPLVKNWLPKSVQYYLWALVLIPLLVPFSSFLSVTLDTPTAPLQEMIESSVKSTTEWHEEIAQSQYIPDSSRTRWRNASTSFSVRSPRLA